MSRDRLLSPSVWAYRILLLVYPRKHRRGFGLLMVQLFRDLCRDALQRDGIPGLARLWIRTLPDTIGNGIVECWFEFRGGFTNMDERTLKRRRALAVVVAGFPIALGLALSLLNPQYMRHMVFPGLSRAQPLGWAFTAGILILAGLAYLAQRASIAMANRSPQRSNASVALAVGGVLLLTIPAVCLVVFGPAAILLVEKGVLGPGF